MRAGGQFPASTIKGGTTTGGAEPRRPDKGKPSEKSPRAKDAAAAPQPAPSKAVVTLTSVGQRVTRRANYDDLLMIRCLDTVDHDERLLLRAADMRSTLEAALRVGRELNCEDPFAGDARVAEIRLSLWRSLFQSKFVVRENSVVEFGESALHDNRYHTLQGMEEVKSIGVACFSGSRAIKNLVGLGPHLVKVPESCFASCLSLETLEGMAFVRFLGDRAFQGCRALQNLRGLERVEDIGVACFSECTDLETLEDLPPAVRELPEMCFARTGIKDLRGMQHVRFLGPDCFRDCKELASAEGLSLDCELVIDSARPFGSARAGHAFAGT
jgi:hypothetical protein